MPDAPATQEASFTCAVCDETFFKKRSDEEALAEAAELFPDDIDGEMSVVCDDCFHRIFPAGPPPHLGRFGS